MSKSEKVIKQSDWSRAFWAITQEPEFSWTCRLYMMMENHLHYHHVKIQKIPYSFSLSKSEKVIKQSDWPRAFNLRTRLFLDMQFVRDGRESSSLSSCKNSENSLRPFFVKVWKSNCAIWLVERFLGHNLKTRLFLDMWFA